MIIKGIFRRYERWNPVHPTLGSFWGMGIGIGCGVGWGPGFGPEVVGYVGAGCGMGFSVGVTLAGIGIGLPVNGVDQIPQNGISATSLCCPASQKALACCPENFSQVLCCPALRKDAVCYPKVPVHQNLLFPYELVHIPGFITSSGTLELARSNALWMMSSVTVGLRHFAPYMSFLMKETFGRLSSLKYKASLLQPIELNKLNRTISSHVKSTVESFQDFRDQGWPPGQGIRAFLCMLIFFCALDYAKIKKFDQLQALLRLVKSGGVCKEYNFSIAEGSTSTKMKVKIEPERKGIEELGPPLSKVIAKEGFRTSRTIAKKALGNLRLLLRNWTLKVTINSTPNDGA
ncbi:hypothetical protein M5K25_019194 [Dendrobium thyrsiflorum]|uniref:Uncharacterized protein n=1 Tax=Dendrobium thyrsiflorum TaxID=117978 RepID=A0ABD0UL16_DENTH